MDVDIVKQWTERGFKSMVAVALKNTASVCHFLKTASSNKDHDNHLFSEHPGPGIEDEASQISGANILLAILRLVS